MFAVCLVPQVRKENQTQLKWLAIKKKNETKIQQKMGKRKLNAKRNKKVNM